MRFPTIKARIIGVALVVAVPTFLLFVFGFWQDIDAKRSQALLTAQARAHLVATRLNDRIGDIQNLVVGLADAYQGDWQNPESNDERFRRIKSELPSYYTFLGMIDAQGRNIGSSVSPPFDHTRPDPADAALFQRIASEDGVDISDPMLGEVTPVWILRFAHGIPGPDGKIVAVLIMGVRLSEFESIAATSGYGDSGNVIALNEHGRVVVDHPDLTDTIGRNFGGLDPFRELAGKEQGNAVMNWFDGGQRITGFSRTSDSPWLVLYGLPESYVMADSRDTILRGVGFSLAAIILALLVARYMAERITRPLVQLTHDAASFAAGDTARRSAISRRDEVGRLAAAFNHTLDCLENENNARRGAENAAIDAAKKLESSLEELAARSQAIDLLGRMSHRLQSCLQLNEFGPIIERLAPKIAGELPGALYLVNTITGRLDLCASWNLDDEIPVEFGAGECWALRRGQAHIVGDKLAEVACGHLGAHPPHSYRCLPLVAQGNIIGVLYLATRMTADAPAPDIDEHVLTALTENISLAVSNQKLRDSLRNDSIVDVLTGLFNRRYLEETLPLEFARAERGTGSVGVVMIDIDHFKRFNTEHGHDGGDAVLRKIGGLLASQIRKGDIVCRFGGEEFILILPGADVASATTRANAIRMAAKSITVTHRGLPLESVTLSFGVASFPVHGSTADEVVKAADDALLRAKANGRDRVEVAEMVVPEPHPGPGESKVVSLTLVQTDGERR